MVTLLPQSFAILAGVETARPLFCKLAEALEVGTIRQCLHEEVSVIGHEAVRRNLKGFFGGSSPKLQERVGDCGRVLKEFLSVECADREEIAVQTPVTEAGDTRWPRHAHGHIRKVGTCRV